MKANELREQTILEVKKKEEIISKTELKRLYYLRKINNVSCSEACCSPSDWQPNGKCDIKGCYYEDNDDKPSPGCLIWMIGLIVIVFITVVYGVFLFKYHGNSI